MEKWSKIGVDLNIHAPFADISPRFTGGSLKGTFEIIFDFSQIRGGFSKDVKITFDRASVLTYRFIQESYAYKILSDKGAFIKMVEGPYTGYGYPLLVSSETDWLKEFSDLFKERRFRECKHYRFCGLNDIIEVLAADDPKIELIS